MRHIRGREIAMVFQEPMTSRNPVLSIGRQLTEPLEIHLGMSPEQARQRAVELLTTVGIPDPECRLPSGCVFHPRCPIAVAECAKVLPELREVQCGHQVACIRV
jgi:oligopeptide/dipeptide ABC transporter ATP-binding protein